MGKRELLIAVAFIVAGVVAYQLTAPAPKTGQRASLTNIFSNARRASTQDRSNATVTLKGTVAVSARVTDLRVSDITQTVQVVGEPRTDIAYEFVVNSTGPDEQTAEQLARRSVLKSDEAGPTLTLRGTYPVDGKQTSHLRLRVPDRLGVRIDGTTGVRASRVNGVRLENVIGDVNIDAVTGEVSGSHRNGNLTVTGAKSATLTLANSTATFEQVAGRSLITARGSHCRFSEKNGPIEMDETNTDVAIGGVTGSIRVSGSGGSITLDAPQAETSIDVRRAEIEATLTSAATVTLVTTDDTLRLTLPITADVSIDALASDGGRIQAGDFALKAESSGDEQRLSHGFGRATSRIVLRNQRADIVIRKAK